MNKLNDKQAFFALYIDQQVYRNDVDKTGYVLDHWCLYSTPLENGYLELTSLSDITDEHAIEVAKLIFSNTAFHTSEHGKRYIRQMITSELEYHGQYWSFSKVASTLDYLRSQGYLLPFRGYTTDQLIDMGWVKLRTNN